MFKTDTAFYFPMMSNGYVVRVHKNMIRAAAIDIHSKFVESVCISFEDGKAFCGGKELRKVQGVILDAERDNIYLRNNEGGIIIGKGDSSWTDRLLIENKNDIYITRYFGDSTKAPNGFKFKLTSYYER